MAPRCGLKWTIVLPLALACRASEVFPPPGEPVPGCESHEVRTAAGCVCVDGAQRSSSGGACTLPGAVPCPDPALAGTVRYFCDCAAGHAPGCVAGDDATGDGSAAAPWRSYGKARQTFAALPAGGIIALCRGGAFDVTGSRNWVNGSCRAGQRCVVRDYTPPWAGGAPRPLLRAADGNVFSLEDSGTPEHEEGYVFLNLALSGGGTAQWGVFVYNDTDDVLLCNLHLDGFEIGVHVAGSNAGGTGDGTNARIVLRNADVTNNSAMGWLGSGPGCAIEHSVFDNNGFAQAVFNHNIYVSGEGTGERVVGNVLSRSAVVNGRCAGVSLVVHGVHDDLVIEGNTVTEPPGTAGAGCWGIAVDPGYATSEAFRNVVIARNLVRDVGNVSIGVAACVGCTIENNVVIQTQAGIAIAAPDRTAGPGDAALDAVTIRNNSILFTPGVDGTAIRLGSAGSGHRVVSNAIQHGGASGACFDADLAGSAYAAFDHNVCRPPASGTWAAGAGNLAQWQAARTLDAHSRSGDPGYVSTVAPYDLSPTGGSLLVDAGDPTNSAPTSFSGATRGAAPDVGAYER